MRPFISIVLLLVLLPFGYLYAEPPPQIRVRIAEALPSVTIEGIGSKLKIISPSGRSEERLGHTARVIAQETELALNSARRGLELVFINASGKYRINGALYKGRIAAQWDGPSSLSVIVRMALEDYLVGLINSEISSSWPLEAIKAQGVAARTYAVYQIGRAGVANPPRAFDITASMLDQVYEGAHQEDRRSLVAVKATRGETLLRDGAIFQSYYHSSCGGHTEDAENVWPGEVGPPTVSDPYCAKSPKFSWTWQVPISRLSEVLNTNGIPIGEVKTIATSQFPNSPRVDMLLLEDEIGLQMVKATDLRRMLGYQNLKSTWFDIRVVKNEIRFSGRGYGHGVGLCQWGAKGMAEQGKSYREILKFYYPDAEVVKTY